MNKVVRNGKVAVLYSPGYGAGWFTWNHQHIECLFHPTLVEMVEAGRANEITKDLVHDLLGLSSDDSFFIGGAEQLTIAWLPVGTKFEVREYDGFESITRESDLYLEA
jgi:hypothetical protein